MPSVVVRATVLLTLGGCAVFEIGGGSSADDTGTMTYPSDASADASTEPEPDVIEPEVDAGTLVPSVPPTVKLSRSTDFDDFLADGAGQPLYLYVTDIPGSKLTTCLDACARTWKPYDADPTRVGPGIEPGEVARFHRQDGDWQLTYKGFPLYKRADELGATSPNANGVNGLWFVARDYLVFLSPPKNFLPAGNGVSQTSPYLTDGFGRTLYVCLDDVPATAAEPPHTTCTGPCVAMRPPLSSRATARTTKLPTLLKGTALSSFERPDGAVQLTFRGWPLYYFAGDKVPGETAGHNEAAWRAIDPVTFGLAVTALRAVSDPGE
jgi:predicted lipoprotein with Yx(FWY)xxD motif